MNKDNIKFDFDDILIVPEMETEITSRYKDIKLPEILPLFTAPMDTVVDLTTAHNYINHGIKVCLPRTVPLLNELYLVRELTEKIFPSFGILEIDQLIAHDWLVEMYKNVLIDVANGHMNIILDKCKKLKEINPNIKIIIGNIANPETYKLYAKSGLVDYIRVGIGNGGGCFTTKQSGIGYPMASLIKETREIKEHLINDGNKNLPAIIADGGMKDYADIIKALALGADYVMLGSIFNKALESAGDNYFHNLKVDNQKAEKLFFKGKTIKKYFRGMSTKSAQKAMGKSKFKTSEGIERFRPVEYTLDQWVENFEHYLRNAMSYSNAKTINNFIGKVSICQITNRAYDRFNK